MNYWVIPGLNKKAIDDELLDVITKCLGVSITAFAKKDNRDHVIKRKYAAIYYLLNIGYSYNKISDLFDLHRTTIMYAYKKATILIDTKDREFLQLYNKLIEQTKFSKIS